jgi:hypothetical protein
VFGPLLESSRLSLGFHPTSKLQNEVMLKHCSFYSDSRGVTQSQMVCLVAPTKERFSFVL